MMSFTQLERASHAFRKGYRDTYNAHEKGDTNPNPTNPYRAGTFANYDYSEGVNARLAEIQHEKGN